MPNKTDHPHQTHPSLLQLHEVLTTARQDTPSCPPRIDPDERLAQALIEQMQMEYRKTVFSRLSFDLQKASVSHA